MTQDDPRAFAVAFVHELFRKRVQPFPQRQSRAPDSNLHPPRACHLQRGEEHQRRAVCGDEEFWRR